MVLKAPQRLVQDRGPLAEGEADVVGRGLRLIEGGDRDRGHAGLLRDVAAEFGVVPGEAQQREIRDDEVAASARQHLEAKPGQACRKAVPPLLKARSSSVEVAPI